MEEKHKKVIELIKADHREVFDLVQFNLGQSNGSSFDFEPRQPIEKQKVRIELLQTIGELEPNGPEPIKNLRERLRTLKAIQMLEPNELEPIAELRERVQALKALKMLEPSGSDSGGEARDRVQLLNV